MASLFLSLFFFLRWNRYHFDTNFLAITSILPILTASFINTRFYFEKEIEKEEYAKIFPHMTPFKPMDGLYFPRTSLYPFTLLPPILSLRMILVFILFSLEIPFIDTDVARGTFLITREDFLFFLDEYPRTPLFLFLPLPPPILFSLTCCIYNILAPPELQCDTVYVVIQFVEIGGDHLDSLMHFLQTPSVSLAPSLVGIHFQFPLFLPLFFIFHSVFILFLFVFISFFDTKDILKRSLDLLLQARKTVYFINCNSLFSLLPTQELVLNESAIDSLVRRTTIFESDVQTYHNDRGGGEER